MNGRKRTRPGSQTLAAIALVEAGPGQGRRDDECARDQSIFAQGAGDLEGMASNKGQHVSHLFGCAWIEQVVACFFVVLVHSSL
jgi:hypothetical protein